jgi:hypothetical protein
MPRLGIYKPFKKTFFLDDKEDEAGWSIEVTVVAKIFAERGWEVEILSDTDLISYTLHADGKQYDIRKGYVYDNKQYDRILLWSGAFELDKYKDDIFKTLKEKTEVLDFMYTDMRLLPSTGNVFQYVRNIYTQSKNYIAINNLGNQNSGKQKYGGIAEIRPYKCKFKDIRDSLNYKDGGINYYFGGTERGRLKDFIEYAWRPGCKLTTKSAFLNINNRVTRDVYLNNLYATKYSIVIADEDYNEHNFITPRHYENILHDVISFIDDKFDRSELLVSLKDWRRVDNYMQLQSKMNELDGDNDRYVKMILDQRKEIKKEYIDGSYVYECLNA